MSCFVKHCKNAKRLLHPNCKITFHRFPKEETKFRNWLNALGVNKDILWKDSMYVCSMHFAEQDFSRQHERTRLKSFALPSRNLTEEAAESNLVMVRPPKEFILIQNVTHGDEEKGKIKIVTLDVTKGEPFLDQIESNGETNSAASKPAKLLKIIKEECNYYEPSPKQENTERKQRYYKANEIVKKLKCKVNHLKSVVSELKTKYNLSSYALDRLSQTFRSVPISSRMLKPVRTGGTITREKYPERKFAITLNFYSPKAYNFVRRVFRLALPHPSVIRKWSSSVDCNPGFSLLSLKKSRRSIKMNITKI